MRKKRRLPLALIGGAFKNPDYLWPNHRTQHKAHLVGSAVDIVGNIQSRAETIVNELTAAKSPVLLCGHSLGALIAYTAAQIAPKGLVRGTALVCPGMIGGNPNSFDYLEMVQLASNPFAALRQMIASWPDRPESLSSLLEAACGQVAVGKKLKNVLVVSAAEDTITLPSRVREVADRVEGTLLEVGGGHDLPMSDQTGETLGLIAKHLRSHV